MSNIACQYEARVLAALESRQWPPEIERHLHACSACQSLALAVPALTLLKEEIEAKFNVRALELPRFELLWWKAQLQEKQYQELRVQKIITWIWACATAVGAALLSFGWLHVIRQNPGWFTQLTFHLARAYSFLNTETRASAEWGLPLSIALTAAGVLLAIPLLRRGRA